MEEAESGGRLETDTHKPRARASDRASDDAASDALTQPSIALRTTINIDDALLAKATKLAGPLDRSAVLHEGLRALDPEGNRIELWQPPAGS